MQFTRNLYRRTPVALALIAIALTLPHGKTLAVEQNSQEKTATVIHGIPILQRIVDKADQEQWKKLPIGELMGKIAKELEGTPYTANTLEISPDSEILSACLDGLDCVTFFESTLDIARMLKNGGKTPDDFLREIRKTRYRGGNISDYSSRLHYTSDWFVDNEKKGVVEILSNLPGAEAFTQKVGFMTSNPGSYKQLAAHPELIKKMKSVEENINKRSLNFIPAEKVAAIEPLLKTGDIIGLCTNTPGLDITHTGLIYRDTDGRPHFMDASSRKDVMKVLVEPLPIGDMLIQNQKRSATLTGIMIARPLEPRN